MIKVGIKSIQVFEFQKQMYKSEAKYTKSNIRTRK